MSGFSRIRIRDSKILKDDSGLDVLQVWDPHALIQAAGYQKHIHATRDSEAIYFRGQTKLYDGLVPSLFRGCKKNGTQAKRISALKKYIKLIVDQNEIFARFDKTIHEPLLQHYGLRTSWIDLVDNIWVALWFACHEAVFTGKYGHYLHFERRDVFNTDASKYAYILLVAAEISTINPLIPGLFTGKNTQLVDLRMAVPSIFLRPHAQHGVLFRQKGDTIARPLDYFSSIRGIIRVALEDALRWLGTGPLLKTHLLFPPPVYDKGYEFLLSSEICGDAIAGAISHIGA